MSNYAASDAQTQAAAPLQTAEAVQQLFGAGAPVSTSFVASSTDETGGALALPPPAALTSQGSFHNIGAAGVGAGQPQGGGASSAPQAGDPVPPVLPAGEDGSSRGGGAIIGGTGAGMRGPGGAPIRLAPLDHKQKKQRSRLGLLISGGGRADSQPPSPSSPVRAAAATLDPQQQDGRYLRPNAGAASNKHFGRSGSGGVGGGGGGR